MLGVHPNTIRAWTDQGRLRCLRINERGDRRYHASDLHHFLRTAGGTHGSSMPEGGVLADGPRAPVEQPGRWTPAPSLASAPLFSAPAESATTDDGAKRLSLLVELSRIATASGDDVLQAFAAALRLGCDFDVVAIAERGPDVTELRVVDGTTRRSAAALKLDERLLEVCLRDGRPIAAPRSRLAAGAGREWGTPPRGSGAVEVYVPIGSGAHAYGVLVAESPARRPLERQDLDLLQVCGDLLAGAMETHRSLARLQEQRSRAHALAQVTTEISSRLELPELMTGLVDQTLRMFGADRAAVYELLPDGSFEARHSRNISQRYLDTIAAVRDGLTLADQTIRSRRAVAVADYADDPRSGQFRELVVEEGYDTVAMTPLLADGEVLGVFSVYHDRRHEWDPNQLEILEALGAQAGVALRNARNYEQMRSWAAQLQSIQQLGSRLTQLTTVTEIGQTIATELRQVIDYHNVRVYRIVGDDVEPIAWKGELGEYSDEDSDQLRLKVGEGITGWVAQHGVAQYLPDAVKDPRAETIPGTEDDLDESMLLAPMRYEDRIIGVIVLSKLGLDRFKGDDELRLLEIYASLAAQAIANADTNEQLRDRSARLARQVENQRELMRMTESILSTLDPLVVMEAIADRLSELVRVDNLAIHIYEHEAHRLRPIFASGVNAEIFMSHATPDDFGLVGWVASHGEARMVQDRLADLITQPGASIVAPLRARDKVTGILTLERLGPDAMFEDEEFELIKLFSGHVSIALQNAMAHQAVEIRAQTDAMTGLKNHGTFVEYLTIAVSRGAPFSLLLADLDDFKSFNDKRGHEAGSQLLTAIGQAIRSSCRDSDEVFRYGGDEFAIILPVTDANGALAVAAKVAEAVRRVAAPGTSRRSGVTCSIGISAFPADAGDRRSLVVAADRACYLAKRLGGDRVEMAESARDPAEGADAPLHLGPISESTQD